MLNIRNTEKGDELVLFVTITAVVILGLLVILALQVYPANPSRQAFESFFQVEVPSFSLSASADGSDGDIDEVKRLSGEAELSSQKKADMFLGQADDLVKEYQDLAKKVGDNIVGPETVHTEDTDGYGATTESIAEGMEKLLALENMLDVMEDKAKQLDELDAFVELRNQAKLAKDMLSNRLKEFDFYPGEKDVIRDILGSNAEKVGEFLDLHWLK